MNAPRLHGASGRDDRRCPEIRCAVVQRRGYVTSLLRTRAVILMSSFSQLRSAICWPIGAAKTGDACRREDPYAQPDLLRNCTRAGRLCRGSAGPARAGRVEEQRIPFGHRTRTADTRRTGTSAGCKGWRSASTRAHPAVKLNHVGTQEGCADYLGIAPCQTVIFLESISSDCVSRASAGTALADTIKPGGESERKVLPISLIASWPCGVGC